MYFERKKHTNKQSSEGRLHDLGSYNERKAFFDCRSVSNCIELYITITLLTSPSKIDIWPKTDEIFSFLLFGWRFSNEFLSFVTLCVKPHKTSQFDWQEHQKLPWSRSEVDKLYEEQKLENMVKPDLWITSLPSTWPKAFSQKLIWIEEYCGSRLIFKMRSEDTLLEKWCISLRFHSVTRQHFSKLENAQLVSKAIKADHEAAEHFVCHRGPSTNHRRDERFRKYAEWLRSINHAIWYGGIMFKNITAMLLH